MQFKKETYSAQVYTYIAEMIRRGELLPGEPVKESFIADKFGISRAPIREALQDMLHQGLLTSEPQKGKYVHVLNKKEIIDSYELSGMLEAMGITESLDRWTSHDFIELNTVTKEIQEHSLTAEDLSDMQRFDDVFHTTLLHHCSNRKLISLARMSCVTISKFLMYNEWIRVFTPKEFAERHQAITDTMKTLCTDSVTRIIRQHYSEVGVRMADLCPNE